MSRYQGCKGAGEQHEQWVGLEYIEAHGYPGFPPADQNNAYNTARAARHAAAGRIGGVERWVQHRAKQRQTLEMSDL